MKINQKNKKDFHVHGEEKNWPEKGYESEKKKKEKS